MKYAFLIVLIVFIAISCQKEVGVQGPAGPQGPPGTTIAQPDTGTITGKLFLFDEFSERWPDYSGAIVTVTSGSQSLNDTTDALGEYHFNGLATGTYNLNYQRNGFGTYKIFGLTHTSGGKLSTTVQDVYLVQKPVKTAVDSIENEFVGPGITMIIIHLDTSSLDYTQYYQNFMVLVGKDANVSSTNYVAKYEYATTDGNGGYSFSFNNDDVQAFFKPGDFMYVTACTYNRYVSKSLEPGYLYDLGNAGYYVDPQSGNVIYPNISQSHNTLKVPF